MFYFGTASNSPHPDAQCMSVSPGIDFSRHLPEASIPGIREWFISSRAEIVFTRGRRSKSGDFRPPKNGSPCLITVNRTLNQYSCLITLLHEMAHYQVFDKYNKRSFFRTKRIKPHGKEWKDEFRHLMSPYLNREVFPEDLLVVLSKHMNNPRASTWSDTFLAHVLISYDEPDGGITVDKLPEGALFKTPKGDLFQKGVKNRKRYNCIRLADKKRYLFSPLARVIPIENENRVKPY